MVLLFRGSVRPPFFTLKMIPTNLTVGYQKPENHTCNISAVNDTLDMKLFSHKCTGKGKAVPLQAWSGPEGSRKLRVPDFLTTAQDGGKVVSLTHLLYLPPGNPPGTHFCQRLSRSQGHSAIGRIVSTEKSNDTIWDFFC
jgi:hypothetical protein